MANNKLNLVQIVTLSDFVKEHYAAKQMTDSAFAELAEKELGFTITKANIAGIRAAFNIPSSREIRATNKSSDIDTRVLKLEQELKILTDRFEVYIKGTRGDSK